MKVRDTHLTLQQRSYSRKSTYSYESPKAWLCMYMYVRSNLLLTESFILHITYLHVFVITVLL